MSGAMSAAAAARPAATAGLRTTPASRRTTGPRASFKTFVNRAAEPGAGAGASSSSSAMFARGGPLGLGTTHAPLPQRLQPGRGRHRGDAGMTSGAVAVRAVAAAVAPALHALEHAAWVAEGTVGSAGTDIFESLTSSSRAGASHRVMGCRVTGEGVIGCKRMPWNSRGWRARVDSTGLTWPAPCARPC